jgi:hypothetical protein
MPICFPNSSIEYIVICLHLNRGISKIGNIGYFFVGIYIFVLTVVSLLEMENLSPLLL